jgi:hypothetical protein
VKKTNRYLVYLLFALASFTVNASESIDGDDIRSKAVPVTDEPLHIVRYDAPPFLIYTNYIMPGTWTLYHRHRTDLLALIAGDAQVSGQVAGEAAVLQAAPGGSAIFFPYGDLAEPYVHRVGAFGEKPFVNVGLEFHDPMGTQCEGVTRWEDPVIEAVTSNRRGSAYRLVLDMGASIELPGQGRGLMLVPLAPLGLAPRLQLDAATWTPALGDFRFYSDSSNSTSARPTRLTNVGEYNIGFTVFVAC